VVVIATIKIMVMVKAVVVIGFVDATVIVIRMVTAILVIYKKSEV